MFIIHLAGPGFCGRGVKFRILSPTEKDDAFTSAGRRVTSDDPRAFYLARQREGVIRMLVAITDPQPDMESVRAAKWHELTLRELEDATSERQFAKIFGCRDVDALTAAYLKHHEVSQTEVDAILGKAIQVAE